MRHFSSSIFMLWLSTTPVAALSRLIFILTMTSIVPASHLPARSQPFPIAQTNDQLWSQPSVEVAPEQLRHLEAAYEVVSNSEDTILKFEKLGKLAEAYSELGDQTMAVALLNQAARVGDNLTSFSYPRLLTGLASFYNNIGEVETAVSFLERAIEPVPAVDDSSHRQPHRSAVLRDIANVYANIEDASISEKGLSAVLDQAAKISEPHTISSSFTVSVAEAYEQLADAVAANEGLSRLTEVALDNVGRPTSDDSYGYKTRLVRDRSVILSAIAKAYAKQNNVEAATTLLAQATELIVSTRKIGDVSYAIPTIATAYGYLPNTKAVQTGLAEIATFIVDSPPAHIYNTVESSQAIASAYASLGDQTSASQVADAAAKILQPKEYEHSRQIVSLGLISDIYKAAGDISQQQTLIQQSYEIMLALEPNENLQRSAINALSDGYRETTDDETAQTLFEQLEFFIRASEDYQNNPSQTLFSLALAAHYRGNEVEAQRLLTETTERLKSDSRLRQKDRFSVINQLIAVYNNMENQQTRRAGLKTLSLVADEIITDSTLRQEVENILVEAYAGI